MGFHLLPIQSLLGWLDPWERKHYPTCHPNHVSVSLKSHVQINAQECIQAATGKIWSRNTQETWICLNQAGQILMLSCAANVWAAAGGVPGCRAAPHSAAWELSLCRWERNLSRAWWRTAQAASAPCVNTRIQTSFRELAFTFYLWLVSFLFFLGCSRQHICSSLDTAFLITITVPGNF